MFCQLPEFNYRYCFNVGKTYAFAFWLHVGPNTILVTCSHSHPSFIFKQQGEPCFLVDRAVYRNECLRVTHGTHSVCVKYWPTLVFNAAC